MTIHQKEERRHRLARLPIEQKIALINHMIEMVQPITERKKNTRV
jgi:hypothetical protein